MPGARDWQESKIKFFLKNRITWIHDLWMGFRDRCKVQVQRSWPWHTSPRESKVKFFLKNRIIFYEWVSGTGARCQVWKRSWPWPDWDKGLHWQEMSKMQIKYFYLNPFPVPSMIGVVNASWEIERGHEPRLWPKVRINTQILMYLSIYRVSQKTHF